MCVPRETHSCAPVNISNPIKSTSRSTQFPLESTSVQELTCNLYVSHLIYWPLTYILLTARIHNIIIGIYSQQQLKRTGTLSQLHRYKQLLFLLPWSVFVNLCKFPYLQNDFKSTSIPEANPASLKHNQTEYN